MSSFNFDWRNTRIVITGALLALAGGILGSGCGSSGLDYPTQQDFCNGVAQVDCSGAVLTACFGSATDSLTQGCVAVRSSQDVCNPNQYRVYHPEFADACVAAHQNLYASNMLDPTFYLQMQQACLAALNNGGEANTACKSDSDCDVGNGLSCIIHGEASGKPSGTCQVPVQVMPGTSCTDRAAQCVDASGATNTFFCASVPGNGQVCIQNTSGICASDAECTSGSFCNASQRCAPQLQDAATCSTDNECSGGFCVHTSVSAGLCASQITLGTGSPLCANFMSKP